MESANDQQAKMITSQKARLKTPNLRILNVKSGSNQTEIKTKGNSPPYTFPLNRNKHPGG